MVKDRQAGDALSHVSISAEGSEVHTVTNDDGRFTLKYESGSRRYFVVEVSSDDFFCFCFAVSELFRTFVIDLCVTNKQIRLLTQ